GRSWPTTWAAAPRRCAAGCRAACSACWRTSARKAGVCAGSCRATWAGSCALREPSTGRRDSTRTEVMPDGNVSDTWRTQPTPTADLPVLNLCKPPAEKAARIEWLAEVRRDQQERWQRGDPLPAEVYVEQLRALGADDEAAVDLICAEFLLRREMGEYPRPEQ